jgi:hypothetical protein
MLGFYRAVAKPRALDFLFRYPAGSLAVPVIPLPISLDIPVGSFADATRLLGLPLRLFLFAVLSFLFFGLIPQFIRPLAFFASFICFSGDQQNLRNPRF